MRELEGRGKPVRNKGKIREKMKMQTERGKNCLQTRKRMNRWQQREMEEGKNSKEERKERRREGKKYKNVGKREKES